MNIPNVDHKLKHVGHGDPIEAMRLKKITVGLFVFAGALYLLGGLRDAFAPGFFNNTSAAPSTVAIVLKFVSAIAFLALAALIGMTKNWGQKNKDQ